MNRRPLPFALVQAALVACVIYMASLVKVPYLSILGFVVLGAAAIPAQIAPAKYAGLWPLAWVGTLLSVVVMLAHLSELTMDLYHALLAGQMALLVFLTANQPGADKSKLKWNFLGICWGFIGTVILLTIAYLQNLPAPFCLGLVAALFLLVLCRIWFRLGALGIQVANTLMLLLVFLPVTDFFLQLKSRHDMKSDPANYYSYEAAKKNPAAFARWTRYYEEQWNHMSDETMMTDPRGFNIFRLRPDSRSHFMHSLISVNHEGFRGPEIPAEKGNAYRIVALGESTTFGVTMNQADRPWPELLEEMIRDRLHPSRPVQVINAGIPAATLTGNLGRLTNEILSLKPDLIISYHGYNGFNMLDKGLLPIVAKPPPPYAPRPLRLLADLEYSLKLTRYKKNLAPKIVPDRQVALPPMESEYAAAYKRLIQITQTNGIRLVLANYSMAVTTNSNPALITFYEQTIPSVRNGMAANLAHSEIIQELTKKNPQICFVNTQPDFDGHHEYFIDLMHFTQSGRQHMAENFFAGIRKVLEADLTKTASAAK